MFNLTQKKKNATQLKNIFTMFYMIVLKLIQMVQRRYLVTGLTNDICLVLGFAFYSMFKVEVTVI